MQLYIDPVYISTDVLFIITRNGKHFRGGVACLELSAKVTLVMDSSICVVLEVALLTVGSDWPPCFTVASEARSYRFCRR
jgi:hypothetical protein